MRPPAHRSIPKGHLYAEFGKNFRERLYANGAYLRVVGMTLRKWQESTDPWDVIADEDREEAIRSWGRLPVESGQKVATRMKNAKTGKLTLVTWSTTAAPDGEGGVIGIWAEGVIG